MKHNNALWNLCCKRQGKENLLRNSLMNKFWEIPETKPLIEVWITHKGAALATQLFQQRQTLVDQRFPNALLVIIRQYRDWAEAVPAC